MLLSKSGVGAAITQVTYALDHVDIEIPSQKGGVMKYFEVQINPYATTVVNAGGDFRLRNSSADWVPCHAVTGSYSSVTEGGGCDGKPMRYYVEKEIPGNSHVYADFRPYNVVTQFLSLTVFWELGGKLTEEHYLECIHPLKAAAKSDTDRNSPGNMQIPGGKGGRLVALYDMVWPTLETVANSGGLRELECDSFMIIPCMKHTTALTVLGASGGGFWLPDYTPYDFEVPDNSVYTSYYTARDDQSQSLSTVLHWVRKPPRARIVK